MHTWIETWQAHACLDEKEVVVITINTAGKATQQHCEWGRPRGLDGCIIQLSSVI